MNFFVEKLLWTALKTRGLDKNKFSEANNRRTEKRWRKGIIIFASRLARNFYPAVT
jgi:hypothetical protein